MNCFLAPCFQLEHQLVSASLWLLSCGVNSRLPLQPPLQALLILLLLAWSWVLLSKAQPHCLCPCLGGESLCFCSLPPSSRQICFQESLLFGSPEKHPFIIYDIGKLFQTFCSLPVLITLFLCQLLISPFFLGHPILGDQLFLPLFCFVFCHNF